MTREEEIQQAAKLYSPNNAYETADTFEYAAQWADKTLLDKACKWWKDNWMFGSEEIGTEHRDYMIEQFRKAMEQ